MNRRACLVLAAVLAVPVGLCLADGEGSAGQNGLARSLIGIGVLAGTPGDMREPPARGGQYQSFTGRHWNLSAIDPETGIVVTNHGGTYRIDGDTYAETVEYASPNERSFLGKTFTFRLKIEGDRLTQLDAGGPFTQVWQRRK